MKAVLHVHQAQMRKGEPALICRTYRGSTHHRSIQINGPALLVQSDTPDSCGARCWIEARFEDLTFPNESGQ